MAECNLDAVYRGSGYGVTEKTVVFQELLDSQRNAERHGMTHAAVGFGWRNDRNPSDFFHCGCQYMNTLSFNAVIITDQYMRFLQPVDVIWFLYHECVSDSDVWSRELRARKNTKKFCSKVMADTEIKDGI
jgi:hypothetical protein